MSYARIGNAMPPNVDQVAPGYFSAHRVFPFGNAGRFLLGSGFRIGPSSTTGVGDCGTCRKTYAAVGVSASPDPRPKQPAEQIDRVPGDRHKGCLKRIVGDENHCRGSSRGTSRWYDE